MVNNKSYLSIIIGVAATCGLLYHFHFLTTQITAATYAHNRSVTYISNKFTHVYLQRRDTFKDFVFDGVGLDVFP